MRQQRITRDKQKPKPIVVNEKQIAALTRDRSAGPDLPVRTVYYVDVTNMSQEQYSGLLDEVNRGAKNLKGGAHYIIPVRNGKIRTDIAFEEEFLKVVQQICEVKDGQIVLKNGKQDVLVIRESI